jgi:uncharacterized heparinase superfamily protein
VAGAEPKVVLGALADSAAGRTGLAVAVGARAWWFRELWATRLYRWSLNRPPAGGLAATPKDLRPVDAEAGLAVLAGRYDFAGAALEVGPGGDPWDRPSPSRHFAVALHRFAWLPDLLALKDEAGDAGAREGLRLALGWEALFGREIIGFAWSPEVLERRVYNLACAARRLTAVASDAEVERLLASLSIQARHLLNAAPKARQAEAAAVAAIAGAALAGPAGEALLKQALPRLTARLPDAVLADGGMRTRSPEAGLELLLDLQTLDDALLQRGREAPLEVARALDRLAGAVRFFTLGDGRLGAFQGGEACARPRIEAALAADDGEARPFGFAPHSGYHRLQGKALQALVDATAPARGAWSTAACAQPAAFELSAGKDRLIVNGAWSPEAQGPHALRLAAAGSTATLGDGSAGRPLTGFAAGPLGPVLVGGARRVEARRNESDAGVWLEVGHDGWVKETGLVHTRRLFLDAKTDELRGEDAFAPAADTGRRSIPYAIRFHLHPDVKVSLARDKRSALLRGPSDVGWWLRNDAAEVSLEPSVHFEGGAPKRTMQVVLKGQVPPGEAAKARWKLTRVEP